MLNTPDERALAAEAMLECALWASSDDEGNPLADRYGIDDFTIAATEELVDDLFAFIDSEIADLIEIDPAQVGHDFWLTRNHHGAGFWDRGLGAAGERLTKAASVYGEVYLYPTGDGAVTT